MSALVKTLSSAVITGLLFCSQILAQNKPEVLTNQTVISLTKAGLDKSVILSTINNSENKFDVSSAMLINLKKQGVANEVISAMVENAGGNRAVSTEKVQPAPSKSKKDKINVARIELINHPYLQTSATGEVKALEKNTANSRTKVKGFGYGGSTAQYEITGVSAGVRTLATDSVVFLVNTGGAAPEFVLFKTKIEKGKRTAAHFSAKPIGGAKSGNNTISCNILPAGSAGIFKILPSQILEKGEYFFAGKPNGSANSLDVYAFAVD